MINDDKMEVLKQQFQRIFTLPVTRLTFRELQSAISTALNDDAKETETLIQALLINNSPAPHIAEFFKEYSVPFRVAKQVQDNGEVLSMLSTDIGVQGENLLFQVRIRRIDGGEFTFLADTVGFLQVAEHIVSRLTNAATSTPGKALIDGLKPRLEGLEKAVKKLHS